MAKRNELCPCGSGQIYKYCCIGNEPQARYLLVDLDIHNRIYAHLDMTYDMLNISATASMPLQHYCRDNGLYYFGMAATIGDSEDLTKRLKERNIVKQDVMDVYKKRYIEEGAFGLLQAAADEFQIFKDREAFLKEGLKLHFEKRYISSIPLLLAQLEGILRIYGGIKSGDSVRPVIPTKIWAEHAMYFAEEDAQHYNKFIHKLYEGGTDRAAFNRNPILHGFDINYHSEEHSLIVILAIMEVRLFMWWQKHIKEEESFITTARKSLLNAMDCKPVNFLWVPMKWQQYDISVIQFPDRRELPFSLEHGK